MSATGTPIRREGLDEGHAPPKRELERAVPAGAVEAELPPEVDLHPTVGARPGDRLAQRPTRGPGAPAAPRVGTPVAGSQPLSSKRRVIGGLERLAVDRHPRQRPALERLVEARRAGDRRARVKPSRTLNSRARLTARSPMSRSSSTVTSQPVAARTAPTTSSTWMNERGRRAEEAEAQHLLGAVPALPGVPVADLRLAEVERAGRLGDPESARPLERRPTRGSRRRRRGRRRGGPLRLRWWRSRRPRRPCRAARASPSPGP